MPAHTRPVYDQIAHLYDRTRGWPAEVEERIGAGLYHLARQAVPAWREPRILEVGVGTGRCAVPLAAQGALVYGLDLSRPMLDMLRLRSSQAASAGRPQRLAVAVADACALPVATALFDAALAVHVLHLVSDWCLTMGEIVRAVRPGGVLMLGLDVLGADEGSWIYERWRQILAEEGAAPAAGGRETATEEGAGWLQEQGYTIEEHELARWHNSRTPAIILSQLRERCFSMSWSLPDDLLERAATRFEAELLRVFGSVERELKRESWFKVLFATHPRAYRQG